VSFLHPPASRGLGFPFRGTFPQEPGKLWAVVLAGGEGGPAGEPIPKQYCAFGTDQPLLRWALRRAEAVVPRSRILVVVVERHRRFWRETFVDLPQENIVVQPLNKGTAPGVLLAALDVVLRRDRDARLLVLPADHHVESEDVLRRAMLAAARAVIRPGAPLVLLGMAGEDADREYGWILPSGGPSVGIRAVLSFVEKPATERSRELAGSGALANSLIFAFRGRTLVRLFRVALPELLRVLVPVVRAGCQEASLREVYDEIPSCDFSRAVLERCSSSLAVLAVPPCGWSDLGTPSRLVRFLGRRGQGHMASAAEVNVS
jgi:mannose-1-phosphate guanylyltransferase